MDGAGSYSLPPVAEDECYRLSPTERSVQISLTLTDGAISSLMDHVWRAQATAVRLSRVSYGGAVRNVQVGQICVSVEAG